MSTDDKASPVEGTVGRIEGYWRQTKEEASSGLPWPVPTPGWGEREFLQKLTLVEATASVDSYRGWSNSRLTGQHNGSREYSLKGWRWPEGLRHYIEHGVKPSQDFIDFIERESNAALDGRGRKK